MAASVSSDRAGQPSPKKRSATAAGLEQRPHKPVKRRASKACATCRSRKVRCNVVEHGAPCTNCRLDQVECIVTESKRRRKSINNLDIPSLDRITTPSHLHEVQSTDSSSGVSPGWSAQINATTDPDGHVPHPLYRIHDHHSPHAAHIHAPHHRASIDSDSVPQWNRYAAGSAGFNPVQLHYTPPPPPPAAGMSLPGYIRPLPHRMDAEDASYLERKDALTIPDHELRNELLRCFVELVDPFMPVLELRDFLTKIDREDGGYGQVSLLVFQAVMFAGSSFADMTFLQRAGFATRQDARRGLYKRVRLLYDFDYETDRVALLQTLLLMTFWHDPDMDQKDTWHWMGIAISVATSIGLNRDPAKSHLDLRKKRQAKRMWWSCLMRDRLIAIGMRRVIRIRAEEHDVPMLALDDFDTEPIPEGVSCIPRGCKVARDWETRQTLAKACIEKAKLVTVIARVLHVQYTAPSQRTEADDRSRTTEVLVPKRHDAESLEVKQCHDELAAWLAGLPEPVQLADPATASFTCPAMTVHLSLLHMIYYMTLSALHRPQTTMPDSPSQGAQPSQTADGTLTPRGQVRHAAHRITLIAQELVGQGLARYLPTTGVTVLQPAIISHMQDIKAPGADVSREGLRGFCHCVRVVARLRDMYAGAAFSLAMMDAAVRHAGIDADPAHRKASSVEDLVGVGLRQHLVSPWMGARAHPLTPPPDRKPDALDDASAASANPAGPMSDDALQQRLEMFLSATPPVADELAAQAHSFTQTPGHVTAGTATPAARDLDRDFEALINLEGMGDAFAAGGDGGAGTTGESSGFLMDMGLMDGVDKGLRLIADDDDDEHEHADKGDMDENDDDYVSVKSGVGYLKIPYDEDEADGLHLLDEARAVDVAVAA